MTHPDDLCVCGHRADDHHTSFYIQSGIDVREECEYYGFNETGGMELDDDEGWIDHCQRFQPLTTPIAT